MQQILFVLFLIVVSLSFIKSEDIDDEPEIIVLPTLSENDINLPQVPLNLSVFGQKINLQLQRNNKLLAPGFQVWRHSDNRIEKVSKLSVPTACYYLHRDASSSAAINLCESPQLSGLIFLENATYELAPLSEDQYHYFKRSDNNWGQLHVVKKAYIPEDVLSSDLFKRDTSDISNNIYAYEQTLQSKSSKLTIELALFFDEAGHKIFAPFFNYDEYKIRDMLLAYVNGIQALFHHPSLGTKVDIALVRLDLMKNQPSDLPHYGGERLKLLRSFCQFTKNHNPKGDDHPNHWDMGLYVSGLDFYVEENGKKSNATMGLANLGGVCNDWYNCVVTEFGVTNWYGRPYPSAGFTSLYVAAHEIGHNLGMYHDSVGNACPMNGYIMAARRGTHGDTNWSQCSRDVVMRLQSSKTCLLDAPQKKFDKFLNHEDYHNLPGRRWDAKKQCEVFLRDSDADVMTLYAACESLQCKSPHRSGYYYAGPALEGTLCSAGKECRGGACVSISAASPEITDHSKPQWSVWKYTTCRSGCIEKSWGFYEQRRSCIKPRTYNKANPECEGPSYMVNLCKDDDVCKQTRRTVVDFATVMCGRYSERLPQLDKKGPGLQAPHEVERPWMACAIFCKRNDSASYYTPRVELNNLNLNAYLPDGTWCHREGNQNYFCRQHHCLPERFSYAKSSLVVDIKNDINFGPQNARPTERKISEQMVRYLSLGMDGRPLLTTLMPDIGTDTTYEDEWSDRDYIELPKTFEYMKESASASDLNFM